MATYLAAAWRDLKFVDDSFNFLATLGLRVRLYGTPSWGQCIKLTIAADSFWLAWKGMTRCGTLEEGGFRASWTDVQCITSAGSRYHDRGRTDAGIDAFRMTVTFFFLYPVGKFFVPRVSGPKSSPVMVACGLGPWKVCYSKLS